MAEAHSPNPPPLDELRLAIDQVDARLMQALIERAHLVQQVGRAKQSTNTPTYAPHREQQVLAKVLAQNTGPLSDRTIEAIYRELMSGSFSLERPMRVGYLGPPGSFSHVAAIRHFGSSIELDDLHQIDHVFEEVAAKRCTYGLVPYENSIGGSVTDTLDAFQEHEVIVYAESLIDVEHMLLANCPPNEIKRIYSKPQAFSQCRQWLAKQFPDIELIDAPSTSDAAQRAATEPHAAAIGSALAGRIYNVKPIFEQIQDQSNNVTRFLIIGNDAAQPTGTDKTSIMFVTSHKPGALVDVLAVFRDADVNLSHIEKRPSRRENWEYTFFIDCDAHQDDPHMCEAIRQAREHCLSLRVLGSYPRAQRVL
jgi:chorismate mutase/prephenate dehydratase